MDKLTQGESNQVYNKIAKYLGIQNLGGVWNSEQNVDHIRQVVDNIFYELGFILSDKLKKTIYKEGQKGISKLFKLLAENKGIKNVITKGRITKNNIINYLEPIYGTIDIDKIISTWETTPNYSFSVKSATRYVESLISSGKKYVIKISDTKSFTLNNKTKDALIGMLVSNFFVYDEEKYSDDAETKEYNIDRSKFNVEEFNYVEPRIAPNNKGNIGFFKYNNNLKHVDLSRYQIYHKIESEEDKKKNNYEACLLHTLKLHGVCEENINQMKNWLTNGVHINSSHLTKLARHFKFNIEIVVLKNVNDKTEKTKLKKKESGIFDKSWITYKLGLIDHHYFFIEPTKYTKYYIDNCEDILRDHPEINPNNIDELLKYNDRVLLDNGLYKYKQVPAKIKKPLSSFEVIKYMWEKNYFGDYSENLVYPEISKMEPSLCNIENNQQINEYKKSSPKKINKIYFAADCESDVKTYEKHRMLAIGVEPIHSDESYKKFYVEDPYDEKFDKTVCDKFCEHVKKILQRNKSTHAVIYFHFAKYDDTLFFNLLEEISVIEKSGSLYSKTYKYFGYNFEFRDSKKLFNEPLSNLPEMFQLDKDLTKKEAIGYTYYTPITINNTTESIDVYMNNLRDEEEKITFMEILNKNKEFEYDEINKTFNPKVYYLEYLKYDVKVLKASLLKFNELMIKITGVNAFDVLTISKLASTYLQKQGCFDNVAKSSLTLRKWIQKTVMGGRVLPVKKYRKKIINAIMNNFDAVSLYPSAMKRINEEMGGIPTGNIKQGDSLEYSYYQSKIYYMVKICITKIGRALQVPCIMVKTKEGLNDYINELPDNKPFECYIDKITLEDYIKYQEIEFTIIEGIYWDEGVNPKLGETMEYLHQERKKHKGKNESMSTMIKLIMNSGYGYTIMKANDVSTKYIQKDKFENYLNNNFHLIQTYEKNIFNNKIKMSKVDTDFTLNFVGSLILSMSKRIMNEVFIVMEDNNMPVYYTDTDSIHMRDCDIPMLSEIYKQKYNKNLIGKELGQFHEDFKLKGAVSEILSHKCITIRPKVYFHLLKGKDKNGEEVKDTYIRIKGVNKSGIDNCINEYMKKHNTTDKCLAQELMFIDFAKDEDILFILNPDGYKPCFHFSNNQVRTRALNSFKRIL